MTGWALTILLSFAVLVDARAVVPGRELYQQHCALCHGAEGRGVPGVFPPLAGSDFVAGQRERSIRAVLEGLSGKLTVNGRDYSGMMPPVVLDDADAAAVLGFVFANWGNAQTAPTAEEVGRIRARTKFPTLAALRQAFGGGNLPAPPDGWELSVGVELSFSPVRLAAHPDGETVLILAQSGDVWTWKAGESHARLWLEGRAYLDVSLGRPSVMGVTVDSRRRLYLVSNQRNEAVRPIRDEVTIFRTPPWDSERGWENPRTWLRTAYPWGIGPFNHGVSHIAEGPDGMLYVNSGSRTDSGETGSDERLSKDGEDSMTACLWRLNPAHEVPRIEVVAHGLRNAFGFCWDDDGRLFASENGPDADAPEELNLIEQGRHYGFPFTFSDRHSQKFYAHTPPAPAGVELTLPLRNLGPDAGSDIGTFDPHSCPSGLVWLGSDWPVPLGGSLLVTRFGNLLQRPADVGFDLLQVAPDVARHTIRARSLLAPLGRPIDVLKLPAHRLLIAEYCRGNSLAAGLGSPGRVLVLAPKSPAAGRVAPANATRAPAVP